MQMQREKTQRKCREKEFSLQLTLVFSFFFIFWGKLDGNWVNKIANVVDVVVVTVALASLPVSLSPSLLLASSF